MWRRRIRGTTRSWGPSLISSPKFCPLSRRAVSTRLHISLWGFCPQIFHIREAAADLSSREEALRTCADQWSRLRYNLEFKQSDAVPCGRPSIPVRSRMALILSSSGPDWFCDCDVCPLDWTDCELEAVAAAADPFLSWALWLLLWLCWAGCVRSQSPSILTDLSLETFFLTNGRTISPFFARIDDNAQMSALFHSQKLLTALRKPFSHPIR